ncbi:putative bacteriocin [Paenibacillus larvae subsp. larvae DSM 25430]|nr:putative bacteriocin [Paenibacillus larvae subsp. larvae DSM 25430]
MKRLLYRQKRKPLTRTIKATFAAFAMSSVDVEFDRWCRC